MTKKQIGSRPRDLQVFERGQPKQIPSEQPVSLVEPNEAPRPWEPGTPYVEPSPYDDETDRRTANPRLTAGGFSGGTYRPLEGGRY